jgi:hypothetical protein
MDLARAAPRRASHGTGQPAPGLLPALDFASSQPHAELPLLVQKPTRDAAGTCDAGPRVLFDRQRLLRLRVQHTNTAWVSQRDSRRRQRAAAALLKRRRSPHRGRLHRHSPGWPLQAAVLRRNPDLGNSLGSRLPDGLLRRRAVRRLPMEWVGLHQGQMPCAHPADRLDGRVGKVGLR